MRPDFYRKFEDRFRGSQERIFSRLKVYIPFVYPFRDLFSAPVALDLGCGRGEWLQLVSQNGFDAQGTDLDAGMLETAKAKGFFVQNEDALAYLKKKENESVCLVSGFHIAEHLPFDVLVDLALEAFRVLVPGGLLILETPNPENVVVGCRNFYMDPTHNHPIPPDLLSFVADYAGFGRVKVLRLQESPELMKKSNLSLLDVLGGVSPDYSVVAQKNARTEILTRFDEPFAKTYGFDLYQLGSLWQQQAEARTQQAEARTQSIEESRSWKITAPLRNLGRWTRRLKRVLKVLRDNPKLFVKKSLVKIIRKTSKIAILKHILLLLINPFPRLRARLKRIARGSTYGSKAHRTSLDGFISTNISSLESLASIRLLIRVNSQLHSFAESTSPSTSADQNSVIYLRSE